VLNVVTAQIEVLRDRVTPEFCPAKTLQIVDFAVTISSLSRRSGYIGEEKNSHGQRRDDAEIQAVSFAVLQPFATWNKPKSSPISWASAGNRQTESWTFHASPCLRTCPIARRSSKAMPRGTAQRRTQFACQQKRCLPMSKNFIQRFHELTHSTGHAKALRKLKTLEVNPTLAKN